MRTALFVFPFAFLILNFSFSSIEISVRGLRRTLQLTARATSLKKKPPTIARERPSGELLGLP
jgi:hypothetical protein